MKRSNLTMKLVSILLFAAVVIYLGVYLTRSLSSDLRTAPAVYVSVEQTGSATGLIVRSEELLESSEENLSIEAESGSMVANGGLLAVAYGSAEALSRQSRIRELQLQQSYISSVLQGDTDGTDVSERDKAVKSAITELSAAAARKDAEAVASVSMELESLLLTTSQAGVTQADLDRVNQELASLWDSSSEDTTRIYAHSSGLFTAFADGYEALTPSSLDGLSPEKLQTMMDSQQTTPEDAFGKLVDPHEWYFAAVMSAEDASNLEQGSSIKLDFGRYCSKPVPSVVRSIGRENDNSECAVVFKCTEFTADLLPVRKVTADIVFSSIEGIRVPREAVSQDENGSYVYTVTGLQAEKKHIEVIWETEDYYLAQIDHSSEGLKSGNSIILNTDGLFDGKVISD